MSLPKIQKALQSLVIKDLEEALNSLEYVVRSDSSTYNSTILFLSQFNSLKKEIAQGIISEPNKNLKENRIKNSVLGTISSLDESDLDSVAVQDFLAQTSSSIQVKPKPSPPDSGGGDDDSPKPPSASGPAREKTSEIYISYKWGGESEKIVDQIYDELKKEKGLNIIRDKVNLG